MYRPRLFLPAVCHMIGHFPVEQTPCRVAAMASLLSCPNLFAFDAAQDAKTIQASTLPILKPVLLTLDSIMALLIPRSSLPAKQPLAWPSSCLARSTCSQLFGQEPVLSLSRIC